MGEFLLLFKLAIDTARLASRLWKVIQCGGLAHGGMFSDTLTPGLEELIGATDS